MSEQTMISMRILRVVLLGGWICGATEERLDAQVMYDLTPEEGVRLGLQHNARLGAVRADAAEAAAIYQEVRRTRLPVLSSRATYTRLGGEIPRAEFTLPGLDTTFTLLPFELSRYHTELSLEQPLFTGGRVRGQIRAAERQADAATLNVEQEEADVAFDIRQAYWSLVAAISVREALDAAQAQVEEHVRNVRSRVEDGTALVVDLLAAQTRLSEVRLERIEAENAVRIGRLELNRLIGLPLETPVRPTGVVEVEPLARELESLMSGALEERPGLAALEQQVLALRAQVGVAESTRYPDLAFVGRYVYARPNPYAITEQSDFRGTWEAGVVMQWRLWDGGQGGARTSQVRARLAGAEARLEYAREQAGVEVTRQYLEVERATEAVTVAALNVSEAEETLRVVRQQFAEGAVLSAQVLEAERAHRAAQTRQAVSLADYEIARAALLRAAGDVW